MMWALNCIWLSMPAKHLRRGKENKYICSFLPERSSYCLIVWCSSGILFVFIFLPLNADNAQTDQQEGSNNTLPVIAVLVAGGVLFGLAGAFIARHLWQKRKTPLIDLYGVLK